MENRDYLKDQIDQMARALGGLLARILNLPGEKRTEAYGMTKELFNDQFDLSLEELLSISEEELESKLIERNISHDLFHPISKILIELGDVAAMNNENKEALKHYHKALELMELQNQHTNTFSFELNSDIEEAVLKCKSVEE